MSGGEPEVLTLVEPAGTLWKETERAVRRALDDLPDGPHEWRIGGGTILAARWGHRKSFDIDLTIGPRANLRHLLPPAGREIEALARRLGGTINLPEHDKTRRVTITFERHPELKDCALDICRLQPEPADAQRAARVDGLDAVVLHTAQILKGKLERAEASPVRDVLDIATAATADPRSLAVAANCLGHEYAQVIAKVWEKTDRTFEEEAREHLQGMPESSRLDTRTLGSAAARALRSSLYRDVRIYREGDRGKIEATTRGGATHQFAIEPAGIQLSLNASGIDTYLHMNTEASYDIGQGIIEQLRSGGHGRSLIWKS